MFDPSRMSFLEPGGTLHEDQSFVAEWADGIKNGSVITNDIKQVPNSSFCTLFNY